MMQLFPSRNQKYWEDAWRSTIEETAEKKSCKDKLKRWDKRAAGFAERAANRSKPCARG